jgi:hypothetical protein
VIPKRRRWQSPEWRAFVRSLPCSCRDPRCDNCSGVVSGVGREFRVVAAHLRSHAGIGQKPDDTMCYPLSDQIHKLYHRVGHPSVEWQLERVAATLRAGFERNVLKVDTSMTVVF